MIQIRFLNEKPVSDLYFAAMATKGKLKTNGPKYPQAFVEKALISEHSFLAEVRVQIIDDACRSDVVSHIVRHTKGHPRFYVESRRPDWTKQDRPTDPAATRLFVSTWGLDALMAMMRQRLCGKSMQATRDWAYDVRLALVQTIYSNWEQEGVAMALLRVLVPNCVYRYGCPEHPTCGWWSQVSDEFAHLSLLDRGAYLVDSFDVTSMP
jgi:hypothetical protein